MHGPDTMPWGYAAVKNSRDSIDFDALAAASDAERLENDAQHLAASEPDEAEPDWRALRARAERSGEEPEPDWNALRAQAESLAPALALCDQAQAQLQEAERQYQLADSDHEAEAAAQRYEEAHAQLTYAQQLYEQARSAPNAKPSSPAQPDAVPFVFASPSTAPAGPYGAGMSAGWDASAADTLHSGHAGGSKWLSKVLMAVAVVALGVGGVALSQFRAAEAERMARAEKLLEEMHQADVAREAEASREAAAKQAAIKVEAAQTPQAEAPNGSSVAAALARAVAGADSKVEKASAGKAPARAAKRKIAARPGKRRAGKGNKVSKGKAGGDSLINRSNDPLFGL